jgi:hypothetical protein
MPVYKIEFQLTTDEDYATVIEIVNEHFVNAINENLETNEVISTMLVSVGEP